MSRAIGCPRNRVTIKRTLHRIADQRGLHGGVDELRAAARNRHRLIEGDTPALADLRDDEWAALRRGRPDSGRGQDFVCVGPDPGEEVPQPIAAVRLVSRLREVRALTGFTRLARGEGAMRPASLTKTSPGWLPAIEAGGEGIFIELEAERVRSWERDPAVVARVVRLGSPATSNVSQLPLEQVPTPRRVLLHSLAHALVDQWALDCV